MSTLVSPCKKMFRQKTFSKAVLLLFILVLLLTSIFVLTNTKTSQAASPSYPETPISVLAAAPRSDVLTGTTGNNTHNANGVEWYNNDSDSMGFAQGGDDIDLNSTDQNFDDNPNKRMSWPLVGDNLYDGGRIGPKPTIYSPGWVRVVYQSNSQPDYYPSGVQIEVDPNDLDGWTQCWSGAMDNLYSYNEVFSTFCTGSYLLLGGYSSYNYAVGAILNGETGPRFSSGGGSPDFEVGDVITPKMYYPDEFNPTSWSSFKVYVSKCSVGECVNASALDEPQDFDEGTYVTDTYTVPPEAAYRVISIIAVDDVTQESFNDLYSNFGIAVAPASTIVSSCEQLNNLGKDQSHYSDLITLNNDINCTGIDFKPMFSFAGFSGTFRGEGHTISNINISESPEHIAGLFSLTNEGALIENLRLTNGSVSAPTYAGAVVGRMFGGDINNVISDLSVTCTGYICGGLAGTIYADSSGSIRNSAALGKVTGGTILGGLIGEVRTTSGQEFEITNSFASAYISSSSANEVGGLVGRVDVAAFDAFEVLISDSYSHSTINNPNGNSVGGLIGNVLMTAYGSNDVDLHIVNSYSSGELISSNYTGGLIGNFDQSSSYNHILLDNTFTLNTITSEGISGAIVGFSDAADGQIQYAGLFYDRSKIGDHTCVGSGSDIGCDYVNDDGSQPQYFINNSTNLPLNSWDFEDVWVEHEAMYPTLRYIGLDINNSAPNGGDGNGDYIADSEQLNVDTFLNPNNNKYITLSVPVGNNLSNTMLEDENVGDIKNDPNYDYPLGLISFDLAVEDGASVDIQFIFHNLSNDNFVARKFNNTTKEFRSIEGATISTQEINSTNALVVDYEASDGGANDEDATINGNIKDPFALAAPQSQIIAPPSSSGILSATGANVYSLVFASTLLLIIGAILVKRRRMLLKLPIN